MRQTGRCAALLVLVVILSGCGRSGSKAITTIRTPGNPPVVVVSKPRLTGWHTPSSSMQPTLHCARPAMSCHASDPDRLLVKPYTNAPRRGEIVVFNAPKAAAEAACNASGAFVKRLIGLPGETVEEKVGLISIDGKPLDEPYIRPNRRDHQSGTWSVQQGRYFFVGDNRRESCDSRRYGAVPRKNIIGQVVTIFRLR